MTNSLIYLIFKDSVMASGDRDTMKTFWQVLTWSLRWLYRGLWPDVDHLGNQIVGQKKGERLAGGFYAALWVLKADLDFYQNALGLEGVGMRGR